MEEWKFGVRLGIKVDVNFTILQVLFADNQILFAESEHDLQQSVF